jgi:raffinose/stachyose/melibiose transport system permease protein
MLRKKKISLKPFLFILPALAVYVAFFIRPYLDLILLSLQKWNGYGERNFVGLQNYIRLADDKQFWLAFQHNIGWSLAAIVFPVMLGLFLAILLSRTEMHGKIFFRAVYFMPQVISSISVAVVWGWIYNPTFGLLNQSLDLLGLGFLSRGWLGDATFALPALILAWSWIHYGFTMVIFIAALEGIDEVYFEVARIDGANWWQQLRYVILPFIRGPLTTIILVTAISSFQVFDLVFALTNGGPGRATVVLPLYMLTAAFTFHKIGYGAAIAVVLSIIVLAFSLILLKIRGSLKENTNA